MLRKERRRKKATLQSLPFVNLPLARRLPLVMIHPVQQTPSLTRINILLRRPLVIPLHQPLSLWPGAQAWMRTARFQTLHLPVSVQPPLTIVLHTALHRLRAQQRVDLQLFPNLILALVSAERCNMRTLMPLYVPLSLDKHRRHLPVMKTTLDTARTGYVNICILMDILFVLCSFLYICNVRSLL